MTNSEKIRAEFITLVKQQETEREANERFEKWLQAKLEKIENKGENQNG